MSYFAKIIAGQALLIVCCIFYLIWWSISYKPDITVDRTGGRNGLLLAVTVICGIAGVVLTLAGNAAAVPVTEPGLSGRQILIGGVTAYFVLLFVTAVLFRRQVTTELVLITGWTMLELTVINALQSAGRISIGRLRALTAVIAVAFVMSIVLYILYYRMKPAPAYYAAMVPLISEGVSMAVIVALSL